MIEQFDSVMLKYATYYAKKLLEFDVAGKNFDLEKRWNYVANKLKGEAYVSYIEAGYEGYNTAASLGAFGDKGSSKG